jgi:hypothetical protein
MLLTPLAISKKNAADATIVYLARYIGWEKSEIINGNIIGVISHTSRKHTLSVCNKPIFLWQPFDDSKKDSRFKLPRGFSKKIIENIESATKINKRFVDWEEYL